MEQRARLINPDLYFDENEVVQRLIEMFYKKKELDVLKWANAIAEGRVDEQMEEDEEEEEEEKKMDYQNQQASYQQLDQDPPKQAPTWQWVSDPLPIKFVSIKVLIQLKAFIDIHHLILMCAMTHDDFSEISHAYKRESG